MVAQPHVWSKHTYPTNLLLQITHRTWHLLDIFFFYCTGSSLLSLVTESEEPLVVLVMWCVGFSLWWLLLLQSMSSGHVGSGAVALRLSCSETHGIFLDQGLNPCPPALAGRFLTTGPPGKSWTFFYVIHSSQWSFSVSQFSRWRPKGPKEDKVSGPRKHSES